MPAPVKPGAILRAQLSCKIASRGTLLIPLMSLHLRQLLEKRCTQRLKV